MPTYEYKCEKNAEHKYTEIRGINDEQVVKTCAEEGCDGKLLRVFSAPPVTFKGTGFHSTSI
jgi:putative FmdB family regulatory protein